MSNTDQCTDIFLKELKNIGYYKGRQAWVEAKSIIDKLKPGLFVGHRGAKRLIKDKIRNKSSKEIINIIALHLHVPVWVFSHTDELGVKFHHMEFVRDSGSDIDRLGP